MDFFDAIKTCLRKYATFSGRAGRPEYWWFMLFSILVSLAAGMISETLNGLVSLALFIPSIAVGARRLHDVGKSGWFQLLWVVPIFGWALLIWWAVTPSTGPNDYGPGPELPQDDFTALPPGPGAV